MNQHLNPFQQTNALDEALLDVATLIELSPRDRRVADHRYRLLKQHLERKNSPLAEYLEDGVSLIYAQGSIATSTTIVSGTEDDRFDVDAIVEIDVPAHWDNNQALDLLEESLQGFPNVVKIERCTRCVQLQFPFMHMDVAIMDRSARIGVERAGDIFHSPDNGDSARVPSNPWGFTAWFRGKVGIGQEAFTEILGHHRAAATRELLPLLNEDERLVLAAADQVDLPPMIPSAVDAQEAVALKLLKRFLNLRYDDMAAKRPPSIYLTKRAGDVGYVSQGLAVQLFVLADSTSSIIRNHIAQGTRPRELNPSYHLDQINDRWPAADAAGFNDMKVFAEQLEHLTGSLEQMAGLALDDMAKAIDELFGERVGKEQRAMMTARYDRRQDPSRLFAAPRSGAIAAPAIVTVPETYREVPSHHFHPMILCGKNED